MKEALATYVNRVRDLADHVKGNEQATKQSLIGPLFTLLGYDLTDPRQCIPEFKADFGKDRSTKPIDWAFVKDKEPIFFVEAKEAGKKLAGYDEQLADYFAKEPKVKLGILTNGIQWRFFTDLVNPNVMDKEPFVKWDVFVDEQLPSDFLAILQKSEYNPNLLRTFAERTRHQNLLLGELTRLLEPSPEFTKLAVQNLETRNLTTIVIDYWKPIVANAINEWAKQRALATVISGQGRSNPAATDEGGKGEGSKGSKAQIVTTQEEKDAFALISKIVQEQFPNAAIASRDALSYFTVMTQDNKRKWFIRLGVEKQPYWIAFRHLKPEQARSRVSEFEISEGGQYGDCRVAIKSVPDISKLRSLILASYESESTRVADVSESPGEGEGASGSG